MRAKELRKILTEKLREKLSKYGFKGGNGHFYRKTSFGTNGIIYSFAHYGEVQIGGFRIYTQFKEIETISDKIAKAIGTHFNIAYTLTISYKEYLGDLSHSAEIHNEKDAYEWINEVMLCLYQFGFDFFDRYYELEQFDYLYNDSPDKPISIKIGFASKNLMNQDSRACKGLIIAKLVDNPNYYNLITIYRDTLKNFVFEDSFEKVVEFLNAHTKEELLALK